MSIDYRVVDGPQSGLTFDFIPSHRASSSACDYDRDGADVFSVSENAFLYLEKAISRIHPNYLSYGHWGVTCLSRDQWSLILADLKPLRADIQTDVRPTLLVERHVVHPGLFSKAGPLNRRALLRFLEEFDTRVRTVIALYPFLIIGGV